MTLREYLQTRPVFFRATLASIKKAYYAEGGAPLSRTEFLIQLGQAGYKVVDTRMGYQVESDRPLLPASTTAGWQGVK